MIHCLVTSQKDLDRGSRNLSPTCPFAYTAGQTCKNRHIWCSCAHGQSVAFNPAHMYVYINVVVSKYKQICMAYTLYISIHFYMHNKCPVHRRNNKDSYKFRSFSMPACSAHQADYWRLLSHKWPSWSARDCHGLNAPTKGYCSHVYITHTLVSQDWLRATFEWIWLLLWIGNQRS